VDPLEYPACRGEMKVISIIYKKDVIKKIEKILNHLELWEEDLHPPCGRKKYISTL